MDFSQSERVKGKADVKCEYNIATGYSHQCSNH